MIGLGIYGQGGAIINEVKPLLPTAPIILLMDDALNDLETYRELAPQAFIIGRLHVPPEAQRQQLDTNPEGAGIAHAVTCYLRNREVDAWQGFNETADTRRHCEDTAKFDYAFAKELMSLAGKRAVVGNFSVGTPHDNKDISLWVPVFKEFDPILGYHGYAQGEGPYPSSLRSGTSGEPFSPEWYELRYRFLLANLKDYGLSPEVVINECGVRLAEYPVSPRDINLEWLANEALKDFEVIGLCPFQWGHPYEPFATTHRLTKDHAELWADRESPQVVVFPAEEKEELTMPTLSVSEAEKALGHIDAIYDALNDIDGFEQPSDSRIPAFSVVSILENSITRARVRLLELKALILPNV